MAAEFMRHQFDVAVESSHSGYDIFITGVHGFELSF
jgi:hypothetical protein